MWSCRARSAHVTHVASHRGIRAAQTAAQTAQTAAHRIEPMHATRRTKCTSSTSVTSKGKGALRHITYIVIGGGILGLATARELLHRGIRNVTVLETDAELSTHQTAHNSGVVHAGLYYRPNSFKAKLCHEGHKAIEAYATAKNIPIKPVGKLVIALHSSQLPSLKQLYKNAVINNVPQVSLLTSLSQIHAVDSCAHGLAAIHSPQTAIINWQQVAYHFADDVRNLGGKILLSTEAISLSQCPINADTLHLHAIQNNNRPIKLKANRIITCAGTQSDRVARALKGAQYPTIIPIRGDYLRLTQNPSVKPSTNIYPLPPKLPTAPVNNKTQNKTPSSAPFLGVHFTPTLTNEVIIGPNAIPSLTRIRTHSPTVILNDVRTLLTQAAFWRLAQKHSSFAFTQLYKSFYLPAAVREAMAYVPDLRPSDFERAPQFTGIRAQAVASDGSLIDDFVFESVAENRVLHVRNAPSPGATAALPIAKLLVERSLSEAQSQ